MSYKSVIIVIVLYTISSANTNGYTVRYSPQYTRNVRLTQGVLRGVVYEPKVNRALPPVEVYRGIPYAAAPVGELRFMPTAGAPSWFGTKYADTFGPVCPQKFPDERNMSHFRKENFLRLKKYLENQSEDCLYLNIYAPRQEMELRRAPLKNLFTQRPETKKINTLFDEQKANGLSAFPVDQATQLAVASIGVFTFLIKFIHKEMQAAG